MNWYRKAIKEYEKIKDGEYYLTDWPQMKVNEEAIKKYVSEMKEKWIPVQSSFISDIAYYEPLRVLEVRMTNSDEYAFKNVPKRVFTAFLESTSKGTFFNRIIKRKYSPSKIR